MPRRPDPNHPMHDAARAEQGEIDTMVATHTGAPPQPTPAAPVPPLAVAPVATPTPTPPAPPPAPEPSLRPNPPDTDNFSRLSAQLDTTLGRLEASNEEVARLRAEIDTGGKNRAFLEAKLQEQADQNRALNQKVLELAARADLTDATRSFQSELVDPDHFAEIYRGLSPTFQRMSEQLARVETALAESNKRVATVDKTVDERVKKETRRITDKLLLRDVPDFGKLMDRQDFQDFLAERIPGTRRTRSQELAEAYEEGDTQFMGDLVKEFRARTAPPPPDPGIREGPRTPTGQLPTPAKEPPLLTEDDLQAAHQQVLKGELSREDYRKLSAAYKAQQGALPKAA